jgi:hypothetical protein
MRIGLGILAAAAVALMCAQTPAMAQPRHAKVGTLDCTLAPSVGLIIGSRQRMDCRFIPDRGGKIDRYSGTARRLGLDIGVTTTGRMIWGVLASTRGVKRGGLAGTYVGASADLTLGLGVGANVLVGGTNRSIMLQPLSVSGQAGLNLALGVAGLELVHRR